MAVITSASTLPAPADGVAAIGDVQNNPARPKGAPGCYDIADFYSNRVQYIDTHQINH